MRLQTFEFLNKFWERGYPAPPCERGRPLPRLTSVCRGNVSTSAGGDRNFHFGGYSPGVWEQVGSRAKLPVGDLASIEVKIWGIPSVSSLFFPFPSPPSFPLSFASPLPSPLEVDSFRSG